MARYGSKGRRPYDYNDPYDPLPRPTGPRAILTASQHGAQGWWVGGVWIEPPQIRRQQRGHPSPKSEDSDCYEVPPPIKQNFNIGRVSQSTQFDFNNSEQALPWAEPLPQRSFHSARSFVDTADDELLSYLANRSISRGFLIEIDHLLRDHPQIADYPEGRDMIMQLNSLSPLEAYKYFLRGYTRPARYIDGIVKPDNFMMPVDYPYQPLSTKTDPELVEFFEGFEYRWDIIHRIDEAVRAGLEKLSLGRSIPSGYRRLVCYAVWGNPSDAYKWYEYQLQEEYLPHRYLPEHVILRNLLKLAGDAIPLPSSLDNPSRHKDVRYKMARANDGGVDVLEVLLMEFKMALVRKGFRRVDIEAMHERAKDRLENERRYPTGVDIVNLVMDEIPTQRPARRIYNVDRQNLRPMTYQSKVNPMSSRPIRKRRNNRARIQKVSPALRTQAAELRAAKANLERAYNQEQNAINPAARSTGLSLNSQLAAARARAERRYVNCFIRYSRDANQMSADQAREMQANFTRRKIEASGVDKVAFLRDMYPQELK